jgi:hypothetical protein
MRDLHNGKMPEEARLRINGHGQVEVELVTAYLFDLKHAYDSILVFESVVEGMGRVPWPRLSMVFGWPVASRRGPKYTPGWPPTPKQVASFVPRKQQLVLSAVNLASPGFWEFLGTLNPLEVLRQYLNDRNERRKDREYRDSAEKTRLFFENVILKSKAISSAVKVAREDLGATDEDLAPLLNELIYRPLANLDRHQDKHLIEDAEFFPPLPDRSTTHDQINYDE